MFLSFSPADSELLCRRTSSKLSTNHQLRSIMALQLMSSSCQSLLLSPPHTFEEQLQSNQSFHKFLDSFLRYAPRSYEQENLVESNAIEAKGVEVYTRLWTRVLQLLVRMSHSASQQRHASTLFSPPVLLDMCAIYAHSNPVLVGGIITDLVGSDAQFMDDLGTAISMSTMVFKEVQQWALLPGGDGGDDVGTRVLREAVHAHRQLLECSRRPTLSLFLHNDLFTAFITCFDITLPLLLRASTDDGAVNALREELFALVDTLVFDALFDVLQTCDASRALALSEKLLEFLSLLSVAVESVDVPLSLEPVVERLSLLRALNAHSSLIERFRVLTKHPNFRLDVAHCEYLDSLLSSGVSSSSLGDGVGAFRESTVLAARELDDQHRQQALQLQELCPNMSVDYALACLRQFHYSFEQTVNAVFEQSLPKHLQKVKDPKRWVDNRKPKSVAESVEPRPEAEKPPISSGNKVDIDDDVLQAYLKLTGRITVDESRRREELRIKEEDSVLVPSAEEAQLLRASMVFDGYDDSEDDTFDGYVPFQPFEGVDVTELEEANEEAGAADPASSTARYKANNNKRSKSATRKQKASPLPDRTAREKSIPTQPRRKQAARGQDTKKAKENPNASGGIQPKTEAELRRQRGKERKKAKVANHNRKAKAARKHQL